jgi:DNA-binding beta-propeller fold protein YncE
MVRRTNENSNTASIINSKTNRILYSFDAMGVIGQGSGDLGVAFYPATGGMYITERGSNIITSVGGIVVPIDKLALILPFLGLALALVTATELSVAYSKRVQTQKMIDPSHHETFETFIAMASCV